MERQKVHERHVHRACLVVSLVLMSQTRSSTFSRVRRRRAFRRSPCAVKDEVHHETKHTHNVVPETKIHEVCARSLADR